MKKFFCLHGLPRAGNTLLGSIINQNPKVAVTANSIIADMLGELYTLQNTDIFKNFPDHKSFDNVTKSLIQTYYKDWPQEYIIDRAPWGIPVNLKFLKEVQEDIKIIVLVRDVEEILASFIKWSQKEPTSFVNQYAAKTIEEKCDMLMDKDGVIVKELIGIKHLLDHQPKEMYHIVEYNDLCDNPEQVIKDIYKFLNIPLWGHRFVNLDQFEVNGMKYDDNIVGQNLHTIETNSINSNNYNEFKENVNDILPKSIIEKYNNLNFWKGK
tara:strand:+ start:95 stop:898 length:804 start_codon:yes stop_codon:yes gene_type:complete